MTQQTTAAISTNQCIYPRIIAVCPPVKVYVLFHGNAGMSEAECVYFCHMNYLLSVYTADGSVFVSAEETCIKWSVND